ncbi:MAG: hypothetical protein DMF56_02010 [Acidobacteria bacterium]|nr:MAG: hypothetical protein DMF56_02010 [Acidobacteriota bacterium]
MRLQGDEQKRERDPLHTHHFRMHAVNSIDDAITSSSFHFGGVYVWARVRDVGHAKHHLLVARDEKETTVVTAPEHLASLDVIETNGDRWLLLSIDCASPFYCVGFIASISTRLRDAGMDILVISTFSRDLFFVKEEEGERAAELLQGMGMRVK